METEREQIMQLLTAFADNSEALLSTLSAVNSSNMTPQVRDAYIHLNNTMDEYHEWLGCCEHLAVTVKQ